MQDGRKFNNLYRYRTACTAGGSFLVLFFKEDVNCPYLYFIWMHRRKLRWMPALLLPLVQRRCGIFPHRAVRRSVATTPTISVAVCWRLLSIWIQWRLSVKTAPI